MEKEKKSIVCEKIEKILHTSFDIDSNSLCVENCDKSLFLPPFNLDGIMLVYLMAEVEKVFRIKIEPEYLENYAFATIDGIASIVCQICQDEL